jgi:hypothetical protein
MGESTDTKIVAMTTMESKSEAGQVQSHGIVVDNADGLKRRLNNRQIDMIGECLQGDSAYLCVVDIWLTVYSHYSQQSEVPSVLHFSFPLVTD